MFSFLNILYINYFHSFEVGVSFLKVNKFFFPSLNPRLYTDKRAVDTRSLAKMLLKFFIYF